MTQNARLNEQETSERLRQVPGWRIENGKLTRAYEFGDFMGAIDFVNRLAPVAESAGHHPTFWLGGVGSSSSS